MAAKKAFNTDKGERKNRRDYCRVHGGFGFSNECLECNSSKEVKPSGGIGGSAKGSEPEERKGYKVGEKHPSNNKIS